MDRPTVIYDGECALCGRAVAWLQARESAPLEYLPCQSDERARRFPAIAAAMCLESMWLVLPDGRRFAGEQALPHLLRRMRGWRRIAFLLEAPGVRALTPPLYRWIARHRLRISALVREKNACRVDGDCND